MKLNRRITLSFSCFLLIFAFGCGKKNDTNSSVISTTDTSAVASTDENLTEAVEVTTKNSDTSEKTDESENVTETKAEDKTSEAVTTIAAEVIEETSLDNNAEKGYSDSLAAAQAFYNAYLNHDTAVIYNMFCQTEIDRYGITVEATLDGKKGSEVFTRQNILMALDASMDNIDDIMAFYEDKSTDLWSVSVTEENLFEVDSQTLNDFNSEMGTSFTSAVEVSHTFYDDTTNGEAFSGNSCAFLEADGKWYLSFSIMMQTDLINYIDIF